MKKKYRKINRIYCFAQHRIAVSLPNKYYRGSSMRLSSLVFKLTNLTEAFADDGRSYLK